MGGGLAVGVIEALVTGMISNDLGPVGVCENPHRMSLDGYLSAQPP